MSESPSWGSGSWASRWRRTWCRQATTLTVWNRTPREGRGVQRGARRRRGRGQPGRRPPPDADIVITMVPDGPEVEAVLLGPDGAAEGLHAGGLVIDMSTIAPSQTRDDRGDARERATSTSSTRPVTGSRPKAEDATLTIMVGGEKRDFDRAKQLLETMGALVVHAGPGRPRRDGQARQQHRRRDQRGRAGRGAHARQDGRAEHERGRRRDGRRIRGVDDADAQGRADARRAPTSRFSSSSTTCSRTCATACARPRRSGSTCRWRAWPSRCTPRRPTWASVEVDFAAVVEAVEAPR